MVRHLFRIHVLLLWSFVANAQQSVYDIRREFLDATSERVLVASHRAAHHRYPENSLNAIQDAIDMGVDIVEVDVKVSRDGVPFLMHDRTMNRTTTGKGDPEEFTWEELQQFVIVDKGKRTSFKIPKLEDALKVAKGKVMVDLDMKTDRIDAVVDVVERTGTADIVIFFDSEYPVLTRIKAANNDFMIMPRTYAVSQIDSALALFNPPAVHIDFSFYSPLCTDLIKRGAARAWINALGDGDDDIRNGNTEQALRALLGNGASIVQTDEPQLLLEALEKSGYRSVLSRSVSR